MIKKVLVVDDEIFIRQVIHEVLKMWQIECVEAGNAEEAMDLATRYGGDIDLVFIDLNLPRMSGREAYEKLKPHFLNKPFVFMSGYDEEEARAELPRERGIEYLKKPFTMATIRRILEKFRG